MFEQIRSAILEYVDVPEESITPDTQFLADLAMNSLEIAAMISQLEDELGVTVDAARLTCIFTVSDLMEYMKELQRL